MSSQCEGVTFASNFGVKPTLRVHFGGLRTMNPWHSEHDGKGYRKGLRDPLVLKLVEWH